MKSLIFLALLSLMSACSGVSEKSGTSYSTDTSIKPLVADKSDIPHFYTIDVDSGKPAKSFPKNRVLLIKPVRVIPKYAGKTLVFNTSDKQFIDQAGNQFILEPSDMFSEQVSRWLSKTGLFSNIETDEHLIPDYVLEVAVSKLYGDVRPEHPPKSVLEMQFFLTKKDEPKKILFQTGLRVDADIDKASPAKVTQGWSEGLKAILTKLEFGLNDYFHKQQGK